MLRTLAENIYTPTGYADEVVIDSHEIIEGQWRTEAGSPYVTSMNPTTSRNNSTEAEIVRSSFRKILRVQVKCHGNGNMLTKSKERYIS